MIAAACASSQPAARRRLGRAQVREERRRTDAGRVVRDLREPLGSHVLERRRRDEREADEEDVGLRVGQWTKAASGRARGREGSVSGVRASGGGRAADQEAGPTRSPPGQPCPRGRGLLERREGLISSCAGAKAAQRVVRDAPGLPSTRTFALSAQVNRGGGQVSGRLQRSTSQDIQEAKRTVVKDRRHVRL